MHLIECERWNTTLCKAWGKEPTPLSVLTESVSSICRPQWKQKPLSCHCGGLGGLQESSLHSPRPKQMYTSVKCGSHFVYDAKVHNGEHP